MIEEAVFSNYSQYLAVLNDSNVIIVYDLELNQINQFQQNNGLIISNLMLLQQSLLYILDNSLLVEWNFVKNYQQNLIYEQQDQLIKACVLKNMIIALGLFNSEIKIYFKKKLIKTINIHQDAILQMVFSHSGKLLASCSYDGSIVITDAKNFTQIRKIIFGIDLEKSHLNFSFDEQFLLVNGYKKYDIIVFNIKNQLQLHKMIILPQKNQTITFLNFITQNYVICGTQNGSIYLYNYFNLQLAHQFESPIKNCYLQHQDKVIVIKENISLESFYIS